jgi:hypothetical protein
MGFFLRQADRIIFFNDLPVYGKYEKSVRATARLHRQPQHLC